MHRLVEMRQLDPRVATCGTFSTPLRLTKLTSGVGYESNNGVFQ